MGVTTISSYIYQTYQHSTNGNDWFGSASEQRWTNLILCCVDFTIDFIALGFVAVALIYVPLARQRLSYLTSPDT